MVIYFTQYNISFSNHQGSDGRNNFVLVTNLLPCYGIRFHLWPEKGTSVSDLPRSRRVIEVTSKIIQIPSGPAPRQVLKLIPNRFTLMRFSFLLHLHVR